MALDQLNLDNQINPRNENAQSPEEGKAMAKIHEKIVLPNGEVKWIRANNRQEAYLIAAKILRKAENEGKPEEPVIPTLGEFVDQVYRPVFMKALAPKTQANYANYLKYYILPFMGGMRMDQIAVDTIQQWYDWLANAKEHGAVKNINRKSIDRISGFLGKVFHIAVEKKSSGLHPSKKRFYSTVEKKRDTMRRFQEKTSKPWSWGFRGSKTNVAGCIWRCWHTPGCGRKKCSA